MAPCNQNPPMQPVLNGPKHALMGGAAQLERWGQGLKNWLNLLKFIEF
jgi:hypothetical protein